MTDLKSLLDFKDYKSLHEIEDHFYIIAQHLFYKYDLLTLSGESLKITDLELYIYHSEGFKDEGMHKHHSQMTSGRFYIHRHHQNQSSFKKPSYIGVDITCGSPFSCYGGILIRETKKGDEYLSCSKTVLELIGSKYTDLRKKKWDDREKTLLHKLDDTSIFNGPAILNQVSIENCESTIWTDKRKSQGDQNLFAKNEFRAISHLASKSKKGLEKITFNQLKAA